MDGRALFAELRQTQRMCVERVAGGWWLSGLCKRNESHRFAVSFGLWAQNLAGVIPWKKREPVALGTVEAGYGSSAWALARLGWAVSWPYPQVLRPSPTVCCETHRGRER